jgi:hypothetical protein
MDDLQFETHGQLKRAVAVREADVVVLRVGRRRLEFPVRTVPALLKMLATVAVCD